MSRQGRPITTKDTERFLAALRLGATRRAACAEADFARTTMYRMLEADGAFVAAVEKAEGEAEFRHTANVATQSDKNWQASAWWLERRHPDDFGRRDRVDITVDVKSIVASVAAERGLDESEVMAEAERILANSS